MISVKEAITTVLNHTINLETVSVQLTDSVGRVLREDLIADRDFPPFNRVAMDGIAINYQSFKENNQQTFPIQAIAPAGSPQLTLQNPYYCIEVMTGAVLPHGTDTVIPYEHLKREAQQFLLQKESIRLQQNVYHQGNDRTMGSIIVAAGTLVTPAVIGIAATIGKTQLQVAALPKTIIISTGDELVPIDQQPLPHQIRSSNSIQLQTVLKQWGIQADCQHLADNKELIFNALKEITQNYDVVIMSGGVSKGKYDYIPEVLAALEVGCLFHRVKQRPGKPFWFGKSTTDNNTFVFALPGNPVSAFMCLHRYLKPWLYASLNIPLERQFAYLMKDVHFEPNLTYYMQVKILDNEGSTYGSALAIQGRGSGDLANLANANAFMELPAERDLFEADDLYEVFPF